MTQAEMENIKTFYEKLSLRLNEIAGTMLDFRQGILALQAECDQQPEDAQNVPG